MIRKYLAITTFMVYLSNFNRYFITVNEFLKQGTDFISYYSKSCHMTF